jgi:hypothetical protein
MGMMMIVGNHAAFKFYLFIFLAVLVLSAIINTIHEILHVWRNRLK